MKKKIVIAFGTRPEMIKLVSVIRAIESDQSFSLVVVATAQHREMLDQTLKAFNITPHVDLNLMEKNQKLTNLSAKIMESMQELFDREKPDLLICQGDTTSALMSGLAAYYNKIPVAHVEAGLRTYDHNNPFPEEGNRQLLSVISSLNFCPTEKSKANLVKEGIKEDKTFVTGNTVVDALLWIASQEYTFKNEVLRNLDFSKEKVILVTAHRRENFGDSMKNIFQAIQAIARKYHDVRFIFPVHLNPNVRKLANDILENQEQVHLLEPMDYEEFVHLMRKVFLILSDSGGVQEEAPSFGVPVLVLRKVTERTEALEGGNAILIGTGKDDIINKISDLLDHPDQISEFKNLKNPFGDGKAGQRVLEIIQNYFA